MAAKVFAHLYDRGRRSVTTSVSTGMVWLRQCGRLYALHPELYPILPGRASGCRPLCGWLGADSTNLAMGFCLHTFVDSHVLAAAAWLPIRCAAHSAHRLRGRVQGKSCAKNPPQSARHHRRRNVLQHLPDSSNNRFRGAGDSGTFSLTFLDVAGRFPARGRTRFDCSGRRLLPADRTPMHGPAVASEVDRLDQQATRLHVSRNEVG